MLHMFTLLYLLLLPLLSYDTLGYFVIPEGKRCQVNTTRGGGQACECVPRTLIPLHTIGPGCYASA